MPVDINRTSVRTEATRQATRQVPKPAAESAQFGRHLDRFAHGSPHLDSLDALRQRLVHRAPAEFSDHVIMRERIGVGRAELLAHPVPEISESHG